MTMKKDQDKKPAGTPLAFDPIEAALRQIFDEVSAEAVPDDFADLVAKLKPRVSTDESH